MDTVRAWKDPVYRASLSADELQSLSAHPAGVVELTEAELTAMNGATTIPCITLVTWEAGCFTVNDSYCNGTCAINTTGCCG